MKLELSIADDRELRNFIKDLIRGEIVSIARGEIKGILADVVKEGIVPKNEEDLQKILRDEIRSIVEAELKSRDSFGDRAILIKQIAREEINHFIHEWLNKSSSVDTPT